MAFNLKLIFAPPIATSPCSRDSLRRFVTLASLPMGPLASTSTLPFATILGLRRLRDSAVLLP